MSIGLHDHLEDENFGKPVSTAKPVQFYVFVFGALLPTKSGSGDYVAAEDYLAERKAREAAEAEVPG